MRPWRLTRRARVEMESLRARMWPGPTLSQDIDRACRALGWTPLVSDRFPDGMREWRILRARVALALRAALRADEDARCEEALGMASADGGESYDEGVVDGVWAMREWPFLAWRGHLPDGTAVPLFVPRALWEVAR